MVRHPRYGYDLHLLIPVLILVGVGIVMVYSSSSAVALKKFGSDCFFLKRQSLYALLGIVALLSCRYFPVDYLKHLTYPILVVALGLLVAVEFTGAAIEAGGASRWLRICGMSFQPSEFVRLALIMYLAYSMSKKIEMLRQFTIGFLPHVMVLSVFISFIFLQPDFGTVIILSLISWFMMFVGGVRVLHLLSPLVILLPAIYFMLIAEPYRLERLRCFWDPWRCADGGGYQVIHSLMAFGTGGIWGAGIGKSYQKLFYLPEPHTDFIFSVIGEELGLVGVLTIVGLYITILYKGIQISKNAQENYDSLLAFGITVSLAVQVFINMGVALSLLPAKGLTLPFISYGGTSLLLNMASIGILMNIWAKYTR